MAQLGALCISNLCATKPFESENKLLEEEVKALEDLKNQFPDIQFKIEQLKQIKIKEIDSLRPKIRAISSLIQYFRE